jgi:hypothetical protein
MERHDAIGVELVRANRMLQPKDGMGRRISAERHWGTTLTIDGHASGR